MSVDDTDEPPGLLPSNSGRCHHQRPSLHQQRCTIGFRRISLLLLVMIGINSGLVLPEAMAASAGATSAAAVVEDNKSGLEQRRLQVTAARALGYLQEPSGGDDKAVTVPAAALLQLEVRLTKLRGSEQEEQQHEEEQETQEQLEQRQEKLEQRPEDELDKATIEDGSVPERAKENEKEIIMLNVAVVAQHHEE